jgi:hypothetical protein
MKKALKEFTAEAQSSQRNTYLIYSFLSSVYFGQLFISND